MSLDGRAIDVAHSTVAHSTVLSNQSFGSRFGHATAVRGRVTEDHHAGDRRREHRDGDREVDVQIGQGASSRVSRDRPSCKSAFTLLALFALIPSLARAAEPESYRVQARVARADGRIEGRMWAQVHVAQDEREVRLWLYPDRLAVPPRAMNERSWRWIYPGEIDLGGIEVSEVEIDGRPAETRIAREAVGTIRGRDSAGADLVVPIEPGPERTITLTLAFTLRVPSRFGRLGRDDGLLSMAAPWYPLVVDGDTWAFRVPHRVEVECADGEVTLGASWIGRRGAHEQIAPYVPALAAERFYDYERRAGPVSVILRTPERLYRPPSGGDLEDVAHIDLGGLVEEVARDVVASARAFGVEVPPRIVLASIPSRTELAANAPGVVLFSDRIFQIFPIDQTRNFHRRALRRALFALLAEALTARADPPADATWANDLRAVVLVDLDEARRHTGARTPEQLLEIVSFHPAVDQLLYAPQVAFEDSYFATIEERDSFRDDPLRSRWPLSRGRRVLEMARDAMSEEQIRRLSAMLVNARRPARAAFEEAAPERVDRLPSWLRASGEPVNYRLGRVRSERQADGRWRHRIEVLREGADRVEPVEIAVHDASGHTEVARWEDAGERGEVEVITAGSFTGAQIDPRHRLPQDPGIADGHPRIDDATDHPWRPPILNGFLIDVFVSEGLFTGLVDFALRRRYDLEHTIDLRLERTAAITGGSLRYTYGLGPKVHTNRRLGFFSVGLTFERLHEFFGNAEQGGWRGQLFVAGGINSLFFQPDPREMFFAAARLVGGLAVRDDETLSGTFRGAIRGGFVLPVGLLNAFAVIAGGGFAAGDALASELQSLGGRNVLRGFESGELLGRGSLYLVVEHRWTALTDLAWNVAHMVWMREIQLVVFAGAGLVFGTEDRDVAGGVEVGGGLRFQYEYGGVQPGVVAIDVGVPVTRTDSRVFDDEGTLLRYRNPVGFYVSFDQYF